MRTTVKFYPEVRRLLSQAWDSLDERPTIRDAAEAMEDVSPAALNSWLLGQRAPRSDSVRKLAAYFFPEPGGEREEFRKKLQAAARQASYGASEPFDELATGARPVRIGLSRYGPFGATADGKGFFCELFQRFAAYAGLAPRDGSNPVEEMDLHELMRRMQDAADLDIALCIFATPDRARFLRYFRTPIRIRINALYVPDHVEGLSYRAKDFVDLLLNPSSGRNRGHMVLAIVNEREVGAHHIQHFVHLPDDAMRLVDYAVEKYAEALQAGPSEGRAPLMVADEYMCARVYQRLGGKARLLFAEREHTALPAYHLAFAIQRRHRQWAEYLEESFTYFLEANIDMVVDLYVALWRTLTRELTGVFDPATGREPIADRWLGLKNPSGGAFCVEPDFAAWKHVVEHAYRKKEELD